MKQAALIVIILALSTLARAQCVIQLTDNDYDDDYPQIDNGQVVWRGYDGNDSEIFLWDGEYTEQITNNDIHDGSPLISGNQIVWIGSPNGWNPEIFLWDGYEITQLTHDGGIKRGFYFDNGMAVWQHRNWEDDNYEISVWDGTSVFSLSDSTMPNFSPHTHNRQVVWEVYDGNDREIFFWDGTNTIQLTNNDIDDMYPKIHNGQITWMGSMSYSDYEIFFYDGETIQQLTDNDIYDVFPQTHNGQVAWVEGEYACNWSVKVFGDVFFYDGKEVIQLTNDIAPYYVIEIQDGSVLWMKMNSVCPSSKRGMNSTFGFQQDHLTEDVGLFLWNGTRTIKISDSWNEADMDDGTVVWFDRDEPYPDPNKDFEIFMSCRSHDRPVVRPKDD